MTPRAWPAAVLLVLVTACRASPAGAPPGTETELSTTTSVPASSVVSVTTSSVVSVTSTLTTATAPVSVPPAAATLRILAPTAGQTVAAPVPIRYEVGGFQPGMALAVYPAATADGFHVDLALPAASGTVMLEDKAFSGRRDLTFALVAPGGAVLAQATVSGVIIEGGR